MGRTRHRIKNKERRHHRVNSPKSMWKNEGKRSHQECPQHCQHIKKPMLVKGAWSKEEDEEFKVLIKKYGVKQWPMIAKHMRSRSGKQCRERWNNHLKPTVKRSGWTLEEDRVLLQAHEQLGNRWAAISKLLPGRPDNSIKNRWNSTLKRLLENNNYLQGIQEPSSSSKASTAYNHTRRNTVNHCLPFDIKTPPDLMERIRTLIKDVPPIPTLLQNHSQGKSAGCSTLKIDTEEWNIGQSDNCSEIQGASMLDHPDLSLFCQELDISDLKPFGESCSKSSYCVDSCPAPGFENFTCSMFDKEVDLWCSQMEKPEIPSRIPDSPTFLIKHESLQGLDSSPSKFLNLGDVDDLKLQHSSLTSTPVSSSKQGDRCLSTNVLTLPGLTKRIRELMEAGPQTPTPLKIHSQGEVNHCLPFNIKTPLDLMERIRTLIKDVPPTPTLLQNHSQGKSALMIDTEEWDIDQSDNCSEIHGASMLDHPDLSLFCQELDVLDLKPFEES